MTHENYKYYVKHRILSHTEDGSGGCVQYTSNTSHRYGLISVTVDKKRKLIPAHRALWMAENDVLDLDGKIQIRHKCGNPRCVNIEHLRRVG